MLGKLHFLQSGGYCTDIRCHFIMLTGYFAREKHKFANLLRPLSEVNKFSSYPINGKFIRHIGLSGLVSNYAFNFSYKCQ